MRELDQDQSAWRERSNELPRLSSRELEPTPSRWVEGAMNLPTLVIAKEACRLWQSIWQCTVDCRSRLGSFAMTNQGSSLAGVQRPFGEPLGKLLGDPSEIRAGLPRPASRTRNDKPMSSLAERSYSSPSLWAGFLESIQLDLKPAFRRLRRRGVRRSPRDSPA